MSHRARTCPVAARARYTKRTNAVGPGPTRVPAPPLGYAPLGYAPLASSMPSRSTIFTRSRPSGSPSAFSAASSRYQPSHVV